MPFTSGNDANILQLTDSQIISAGAGDDTYILAPDQLQPGQSLSITDDQGINTLKLVGGLEITSSKVASDTVQLTLSNGAVVTLQEASTFHFNVGGTALTGGVVRDFTAFVQDTLGVSVPAAGGPIAEGSTFTVNADGSAEVDQPIDPGKPGLVHDLTTEADVFAGSADNDTFNASVVNTLNSGDKLIDNSTDDHDVLNATLKTSTAVAPTLKNIEEINLNSQTLGAVEFNAANVSHGTVGGTAINVSSDSKVGMFGHFTVKGAGDNNVTAGDNITKLTVEGLKGGVVDVGMAGDAVVNTSAVTDAAHVTVNGALKLDIKTAADLALNAAADAVVSLTSSNASLKTIMGDGEGVLALKGDFSGITGVTGVDTVAQTANSAVNASEWSIGTFDLALNGYSSALTVADGQRIVVSQTLAGSSPGTTIKGDASNAQDSVTITSDLASVGSFALEDLGSATVELTHANGTTVDDVHATSSNAQLDINSAGSLTFTTHLRTGGDTRLNAGGDISANIIASSDETVTLNATGDANIMAATGIQNLDASGVEGALQKSASGGAGDKQEAAVFNASADITVVGGQGNNSVEFNSAANTISYTGQAGNDSVKLMTTTGAAGVTLAGGENTVDAAALTTGVLAVETAGGDTTVELGTLGDGSIVSFTATGSGNDTITVSSTAATGSTITTDFAAGTNTLMLADGVSLGGATLSLSGLTDVVLNGNGTFVANQLDAKTLDVSNAKGVSSSTLTVASSSNDGETIDLSGLTLDYTGASVVAAKITGGGGDDTIIGTNANDTLTGGQGEDTLTGGAGADTFVLNGVTNNMGIDTITDFVSGEDSIKFVNGAQNGLNDLTGINFDNGDYADLDAVLATFASGNPNAGNLGALQVAAFEFAGDTYAIIDAGSGTYDNGDTVVRLIGVDLTLEQTDFIAA